MTHRIKVASDSFRRIRHTGKTYPKVDAERFADVIGAGDVTRGAQLGGAPHGLHAIRNQLAERLLSTGGRPSLAGATRRQKIPLTPQDWEALERIAERLSERGNPVTPGQVASALVHEGLKHAGEV